MTSSYFYNRLSYQLSNYYHSKQTIKVTIDGVRQDLPDHIITCYLSDTTSTTTTKKPIEWYPTTFKQISENNIL